MKFLHVSLAVMTFVGPIASLRAQDAAANAEAIAYFETHIRPVLATKCYDCHSANVQAKGGLRLDTKDGILVGGSSGPALSPGNPDGSLLVDALKYNGLQMPPKERLSDEVIAHFEEWIRLGAVDPREGDPASKEILGKRQFDFAKEREHWAYVPPTLPVVNVEPTDHWSVSEIDRLVLEQLTAAGQSPAADVDRATWLRRVTLDLTGLPPTPGELLDFELDNSATAREKVVDRLLSSERFGERWGRHWLDVVRYGESTGKERNFVFLQAWRYRDYVIDAFNTDKPFNTFVTEQVAGDLLPHANDQERDLHNIATGFLALSPKGINDRNRESFLLEIVDEQIESVGRGLMAVSIGCARCHDHKYDAVPTTDYYALAGIFRSSEVKFGMTNRQRNSSFPELLVPLASNELRGDHAVSQELLAKAKEGQEQFQKRQQKVRKLRQAVARLKAREAAVVSVSTTNGDAATTESPTSAPAVTTPESAPAGEVPAIQPQTLIAVNPADASSQAPTTGEGGTAEASDPEVSGDLAELEKRLEEKEKEFRDFQREIDDVNNQLAVASTYALAMAVVDRSDPADVHIRIRGEVDRPGNSVARGFLSVLPHSENFQGKITGSGRLQLAEWLTSKENPLVSRVYVNRVWSKLLGQGIVSTPDDFGVQGQKPTNGKLLDLLAVRFTEQGWSTKTLIRTIVLSRVYAVGSQGSESLVQADPENKLFGRWQRRRLEAEVIRDAVLSVAGTLELSRPSGTPLIELGTRELGAQANYTPLEKPTFVRSVYLPVLRGKLPEMLAAFDMADPSLTTGKRDTTSGPNQALFLLNSPLVLEQSNAFARRVIDAVGEDDKEGIELAFRLVLSHKPNEVQTQAALAYLESVRSVTRAEHGAEFPQDQVNQAAWSQLCQSLFALPEFRYVF
jgi:cytochrome c553